MGRRNELHLTVVSVAIAAASAHLLIRKMTSTISSAVLESANIPCCGSVRNNTGKFGSHIRERIIDGMGSVHRRGWRDMFS